MSPLKPYYQDTWVTLYHGNYQDILPHLPQVNMVLTDPPYGAVTHRGARTGTGDRLLVPFACWHPDEFIVLCRHCLSVCTGWVLMTCEWQQAARLEDAQLPLVRLGVWIKPNAAPQFTGDRPGTGWEAVVLLHSGSRKHWNGGGHHAVWIHNIEQGVHPTQKPLGLVKQWIQQFSGPGDTILDPCAGAGTTLVAAKALGRKAIGIEIAERYADIAVQRLEQDPLPFPIAAPVYQEALWPR